MPTLKQYWTDEVARIQGALNDIGAGLLTLRNAVVSAEAGQRSTADDLRADGEALAAARRALAGIPMPADGDPLLQRMQQTLVDLRADQARLAAGAQELLDQREALAEAERRAAALEADLRAAQQALKDEAAAAAARQALADRLTAGDLATLSADADAALATHGPTATVRVEGEFPTHATAARSLLARVRARRRLVSVIADGAAGVEAHVRAALDPALARAQRAFDQAWAELQAFADSAAQLAADTATLARLAALPAPNPPDSYSILTRWQHDQLHDASRKAKREATLAKLTAVDTARDTAVAAQAAYDKALHAAMKAEPDATRAQLDATTLAAEKAALDGKLADLGTARDQHNALPADDRKTLDEWLAAVPDTLWDALDSLDAATARLERIKGPPLAAALVTAMNNAETALEAALRSARLAARQTAGGAASLRRAAGLARAQRDTVAARAAAMTRGNALF